jgi:Cu(I)/Ag(I) efflux system membrane fusion protein
MKQAFSGERLRHLAGSVLFVLALGGGALVFRRELRAWFSDEPADVSEHERGAPKAATPQASASGGAAPEAAAIDHYTCPMHTSVAEHAPGKCPICGMALVPVLAREVAEGIVTIDDARRQLGGVRTESVVLAPLEKTFRAVGRVTYDETKLTDVTLKVGGFVQKLFVSRTGQRVEQGQPLFELFSPELFGAEQDFLLTATTPVAAGAAPDRATPLARAGRQRLRLLGLSDAQIDAIAARGTPAETITFPSPASGFVIEKDVVEGAAVEAGMRVFRLAKLDKVWVEAEIYEADLPHVHVGQPATVTLDYVPGRSYEGKVTYVYPFLDATARTLRVRVELANRDLELRPGMYASVRLASDAVPRVQVPTSAVVYTGPRRLVFVDLGGGHFRPEEVRVGAEANGKYEVLAGLEPGDRVVTSGVFLVAAEARIGSAAKYWEPAAETPPESPTPSATAALASSPPAQPSSAPKPKSPAPARTPTARSSAATAPATVFTCPMHPEVRSPTPGKCPKCGMDLVPAPKSGAP